jgi:hypothetical protein
LTRNQKRPIHDTPPTTTALANGPCQPPKKSVTVSMDMIVRPPYSLR